ncbi:hypothetical protein KPL78_09070 [Roseomonas sp. HJA6]|uniref:Nucleotide-diphospho-sugar transferase domain-containing protein n=1 Tax=Roseomonas alba TaxID=2846776 RepID=A0ABS7A794_9PROT|nr:hypothetical protein [Neoroseomonas alba]MBW6397995.1 hypothetical protein [Neoroseomonas alba]
MTETISWTGLAVLVLLILAGIVAGLLYAKLKDAILQFQRRLDGIGQDLAAAGREMAGTRQDVAEIRQEMAGSRQEATGTREETAVARQELAALRQDAAAFREEAVAARQVAAADPAETAAIRQEMAALVQRADAIRADLARLFTTTRVANILANPIVLDHLAALREEIVPPPRVSYPFRAAVGALAPRITRRAGTTVLCTVALGEAYLAKIRPAILSHEAYAEARGISHAILSDPPSYIDRPPSWMKIALIMHLFAQGFDRVAFVDADALITNPAFDLDAAFGARSPNGSLTLTEDEAGINCGVMFLEDGPAIRRVLDLVWLFDADITNGTWEQYALKALMALSNDITQHITIVDDPRVFNAFPEERNRFYRTMARSVWQPGDFLCHFSGIRSPHLEALIEHYAARTAWGRLPSDQPAGTP